MSTPIRYSPCAVLKSARILLAVGIASLLANASAQAGPRSFADLWQKPAPPATGTPHPSVARITALESNAQALGSGTLIDTREQYGLVITNWHVVRDATGDIYVTFPSGFQSKAQVLQVDKDWDLAALVIWRPDLPPVPLTDVAPRPGDPLMIAGYGSGKYRAVAGRCTQYVSPSQKLPHEMVEVSVEARQGDSGGPIFNERGELAGVLFGAGGGTTAGSWAGRVRTFLGPLAATLGQSSRDSTHIAQGHSLSDKMETSAEVPERLAARSQANATSVEGESSTEMGSNTAFASLPRTSVEFTDIASGSQRRGAQSLASQSLGSQRLVPVPPVDESVIDPTIRPLPPPHGSHAIIGWDHPHSPEVAPIQSEPEWHALAGKTLFEQTKSALALIGILTFLIQIVRLSRAA